MFRVVGAIVSEFYGEITVPRNAIRKRARVPRLPHFIELGDNVSAPVLYSFWKSNKTAVTNLWKANASTLSQPREAREFKGSSFIID